MALGLGFSTVNADAKLPIGTTLRCPMCRKNITALGALQADLAEETKASEPIAITDGMMLGWATSCGCLISASTYTLEIRFRTNPGGEPEVTSASFTRNPVYRDLPMPEDLQQSRPFSREMPHSAARTPLIG